MATSKDALYRSVRNLYDTYRSTLLSKKYSGYRLNTIRQYNTAIEILIAVSASSSVGAMFLWQTDTGKMVWGTFSAIVAVLAIMKPILQLSKKVEGYSKLFTGYDDIYFELKKLVDDIQVVENYTDTIRTKFDAVMERLQQLKDEDPRPNKRLCSKLKKEVNNEVPIERLWWPKREGG